MDPPVPKATKPGLGMPPRPATLRPQFHEDDDEPTEPGTQSAVLYQHLLVVFDSLSMAEKTQLLSLANAFAGISPAEKALIVAAAERLSGI